MFSPARCTYIGLSPGLQSGACSVCCRAYFLSCIILVAIPLLGLLMGSDVSLFVIAAKVSISGVYAQADRRKRFNVVIKKTVLL